MEKRENADINIVLVGLDYNYCLEVGKMLSSQLEMYFLDSQGLYEFDIRPKTMEDIINEMGMDYYRKAQSGTIKYICSFTSSILVVESGALMNEENVNKLDFTKIELDYILQNANFNDIQLRIFNRLTDKFSSQKIIKIAIEENISERTVSRIIKQIKNKIKRLL